MCSCASNRLNNVKKSSGKSVCVLRLCFVFGETIAFQGNNKKLQAGGPKIVNRADQTRQKASTINSSTANATSVLVSFTSRVVAGDDKTSRLVDSRRRWPGVHFRDVLPPHHHHHVDQERVGGHRHAAQKRRLAHPARPGPFRLRRTLSARLLDIRQPRLSKHLER